MKSAETREIERCLAQRLTQRTLNVRSLADQCRHREHDRQVRQHGNEPVHEIVAVIGAGHRVENDGLILELSVGGQDGDITKRNANRGTRIVEDTDIVIDKGAGPHHIPFDHEVPQYRDAVGGGGYGGLMTEPTDDITALSVSAASRVARDKIAQWKTFWLEGEIAEWRSWQNIVFFTVKDESARIDGKIDASTITASGETYSAGDKVRLFGQFDFWPKNGEIKFVVTTIRREGLGDFLVAIEKLRATLQAEGAFDDSRKVPLPKFPRRIGLITSKDSDAEKDVLVNARNRWADVQFTTIYTGVSGDGAVAQIPDAIAKLDADPDVDVIIIARGGGAFLELVAFSDERIVRAAMACVTPLVSAIGHENDRPLLDEVADLRASTPTDAAKRVVPDVAADLAEIDQLRARGRQIVTTAVSNQIDRIRLLASRPVMASPLAYLERHENDLTNVTYRGSTLIDSILHQFTDRLHGVVGRLRTLSPQNTLDRGYAIVRGANGAVVTTTKAVTSGDALAVRVADGDIATTAN